MHNASWGSRNISALASALCICFASSALAYEATLSGPLDEELAAELQGGSLLIEQSLLEETPDVREIVSSAQADYRRLLAVLYSRGYFGPTIEIKLDGREAASILAVTPPERVSVATITVDPGRQFRFGAVEVSPLNQNTTLPEELEKGEVARITLLQSAAASAVSGWRDAGHAKAEVTDQQITARHGSAQIDAKVRIDPGPKLSFGALRVRGESAVSRERIIEIAGLPEGEQFSPEEVRDAAGRLRRSGAFRSVAMIEGEVSDSGDTLPINVRVADNKPRRLGFGGEFATIEGVTLSGFWLHRNIFGGAESLRFDAEIGGIGGDTGGIDYLLGTRFERPATFSKDINFFAFGEIEQEDEPNYFSRSVSVGAGITYFATDERTYRFGLGFSRATTEDAFGDSDYTLFLLPVGATYDYRNNELDARRGYYAEAKLTPFVALSGTDNGLLSELDVRTYLTAGETSPTTLALRAQLGSLAGPSLRDAPADFLFYSGGGGTVRGQDFESLGVDVGGGDIIGGRSFLGLSAELRLRTTGSLGYIGFVDAGYIGEEAFPDGSGEWHSGAGVGIRYETPIGPLRFDVGVPTSGDTDGESFQLYFGIGQSF
ncbi:autotransporter assembly complex protein TamA [Roseobacter denitrificans]|nr:BamA/TamA family outer membrane protein [Roseobacter denitrificans]SFG42134.1 autotransporter secretion outer membrane protein TamA [Roseobacter denitrificans OCh 114]